MRVDRLAAAATFLFYGTLGALAQEGGEVSLVSHAFSAVPTTLATLPNDSGGLTVDPETGILYTAEAPNSSGDCIVRRITTDGAVSTVGVVPKPMGGACAPRRLEFRDGHLYISDQGMGANGWVFEMDPATGQATTFVSGVPGANGLAFDSAGNLWITDGMRGPGRVFKRDAATGIATEVFRVPPVANGTTYGGRLGVPTVSGIGRQYVNVPAMQPEVKFVANGIAVGVETRVPLPSVGAVPRRTATLFVADAARGAIWAAHLDEHYDLAPEQTGCDPTVPEDTLCEDAVYVAHPRLEGADGVWADSDGALWVAANARQGIVRIDRRGHVTEFFRNPVNSQLLRSSADTAEANAHILEYPISPVIVPAVGGNRARTLCVSNTDRSVRDNWPATDGEIGGPGQNKGKISCF